MIPDARAVELAVREMTEADLDAVIAIEQEVYEFPWTRGNFADSLNSRYVLQVLVAGDGAVLGYFVAMPGVEEMHLLNIAVAQRAQRHGLALQLLDAVLLAAVLHGAQLLWLEVRPSNRRAQHLYERYGFHAVAKRRGYYPATDAEGRPGKEDAIVMSARVDQLCQRRGLD